MIVFFGKLIDNKRAIINEIFKSAVEKAVVAKCFLYCSRLAKNVTIKIKSKYQKLSAISGAAKDFAF